MLQIFPVDPAMVEVALSIKIDMPAVAYVAVEDDELAGTGGLAWGNGRCWIWFSITAEKPKPTYAVATLLMSRKMKAKAAQLGESAIFAIRDPQYETSTRLMKLAGFVFHALEDGNEIFRCDC